MNIDEKIQEMCDLPGNDEHFICKSLNYNGEIHVDILDFDEMRTWLIKCQAEVPAPMVEVVNERTGEKV